MIPLGMVGAQVKYATKIPFTCFFFLFFNVATWEFKRTRFCDSHSISIGQLCSRLCHKLKPRSQTIAFLSYRHLNGHKNKTEMQASGGLRTS